MVLPFCMGDIVISSISTYHAKEKQIGGGGEWEKLIKFEQSMTIDQCTLQDAVKCTVL